MIPTYRDYDGRISGLPVVGIVARARTYRNLVLLFLLFPIGVTNFVVLFTAVLFGIVLAPVIVGLVILVGVLILVTWMAVAHARFLSALTDADIQCSGFTVGTDGLWAGIKSLGTSPRPYLLVIALFATFPIGIGSFVFVVVGLTFSIAMILAPVVAPLPGSNYQLAGEWILDTPIELIGASIMGVVLLLVTLWVGTVAAEAIIRGATAVLEYDTGTINSDALPDATQKR